MKNIVRASILLLSLIIFPATQSATAQTAGGRYQFIVENDLLKYVEFDARAGENGSATGPMTFTDQATTRPRSPSDWPRSPTKTWRKVKNPAEATRPRNLLSRWSSTR